MSDSSALAAIGGSPRRMAVTIVGALLLWTALLGVVASVGGQYGVTSATTRPVRSSSSLPPRRRLRATLPRSAEDEDEDEDGRWADKLLGDLQSSSTDESVSATINELRSTLAARDERRESSAGSPSRLASSRAGRPAMDPLGGGGGELQVPRYNPASVDELQKAALSAALPASAKGPLPQLVRDMSAAMQRQQAEHEALSKKLAQLQPSVLNYNPKDIEQLGKAAGHAVESQGPEVSGALPKLLKDLTSALKTSQGEQKKLEKRMAAVAARKARATKRAGTLKELLLRSGSTRVEERVSILFGELQDRATQAVEEARQAAELDGTEEGGGSEGGEGGDEDKGRWQDTAQRLQDLVLDNIKMMNENNASLTASRDEERAARLVLEERLKLMARPPALPPQDASAASAAATSAAASAAASLRTETTETSTAAGGTGGTASAAGGLVSDVPSPEVTTSDVAVPEAVASEAAPVVADSPPPPSPPPAAVATGATGACAGKRCPAGYDMVDRGDRCTCRPQAPSTS